MFNKFKNFWTLKRTVVAIVCCVFTLALTGTLVWQLNKNSKRAILPETQIEREDVEYIVGPVMSTKHEREQQNENPFNPQLSDDEYIVGQPGNAYHTSGHNLPNPIYGGTTFQLVATAYNCNESCSEKCYTLRFSRTDYQYDVPIHINKGYIFSDLYVGDINVTAEKIKNGDGSNVYAHWFYVDPSNNNIDAYSNSEACDPNYTGEIRFVVVCKVQTFALQTYHITQASLTYDIQTYKNTASIELTDACVDNSHTTPDGQGFDCWMINPDYRGLTVSDVFSEDGKNKISVSGTGVYVKFTVVDADPNAEGVNTFENGWYKVTDVQGYGIIPQDVNNILIMAKWKRIYSIEVDNSYATYWQNEDFKFNDDRKQLLYGATKFPPTNSSLDEDFNKVLFDIWYDTEAEYYYTNEHPFYQIAEDTTVKGVFDQIKTDTSPYVAYNYGHKIEKYEVYVILNNDGEERLCCYDAGDSLALLASGADTHYSWAYSVKFVIKPVWEAVKFNVVDTNGANLETNDGVITYGDENGYTLKDFEPHDGATTFVGYDAIIGEGNALVAKSAVWNYTEFGENYQYNNGVYSITLEPCVVNNLVKVQLEDVVTYNANQYKLTEDSEYEFSTDVSEKANAYTVSTSNYENQPLVDDYISILETQISSWVGSLNGSHPFMGKVFADGTVDEGVLTTENDLFIYLAHQTEFAKTLPSFISNDRHLILWKTENAIVFESDSYNLSGYDFSEEKSEYVEHDIWGAGDGTTLTPIYVYSMELYYEDQNTATTGKYAFIKSGYYGAHTPLDLPILLATIADGKAFAGWIVDLIALNNYKNYSKNNIGLNDATSPITVLDSSFNVTFSNVGPNRFNNGNSIWIYSTDKILSGSGIFDQNSTCPIVKAKYETAYQATIDNSGEYNNIYWTGKNLDGGLDDYGVGVGNSSSSDVINFTGTINISNSSNNSYPFMSSQTSDNKGLSFYHKDDWKDSEYVASSDSGYYYVYNYGHYIKSWEITFVAEQYGAKKGYYFSYLGNSIWNVLRSDDNYGTDIDTIASTNMQELAAIADEYFQSTFGDISAILVPHWEKVNIEVEANGFGNVEKEVFTYASNYELKGEGDLLNTSDYAQSLFAYSYYNSDAQKDLLIATKGVWNYKQINKDVYKGYAVGEGLGAGIYTLLVDSVWTDDIWKVTLDTPYYINFKLTNTDFVFATTANKNTANYYSYLRYSTQFGDYIFNNYADYTGEKTLIEDYVEYGLNVYLYAWKGGIESSSFEIFKKVNFANGTLNGSNLKAGDNTVLWIYLANNQTYSDLPAFEHEYQKLIFWQNESSNYVYTTREYNEKFKEELKDLVSVKKWALNDGNSGEAKNKNVTLNANYVYNIKMYYEDKNPNYLTGITYIYDKSVDAKWYGKNTLLQIYDKGEYLEEFKPDEADKPDYASKFKHWVFNEQVAMQGYYSQNINFNVNHDNYQSDSTITLTADGIKLTLTIIDQNKYNPSIYYVSAIQGYGVIEQDQREPFLIAQWAKFYEADIDNSYNPVWNGVNDNEEKRNLFGARSKLGNGVEKGEDIALIQITDDSGYAYPFMSSEGKDGTALSFWHKSDWADKTHVSSSKEGYYYVYNYGHYISNWEIQCGNSYFVYNGSWQETKNNPSKEEDTYSAINYIITQTMQNLSNELDEYFAYVAGELVVTIKPIWAKTTINVVSDRGEDLNKEADFKFADPGTYGLPQNTSSKPEGKSLFAYSYDNETTLIAIHGVWDYKYIPCAMYEYAQEAEGTTIGSGTYTIEVSHVWINDIYKVTLKGAKPSTEKTFTLSNCDYSFKNDNNGKCDGDVPGAGSQITFRDAANILSDEYTYQTYSGGYVDDYIKQLIKYRDSFLAGINGDGTNDFSIFRKVYWTFPQNYTPVGGKVSNLVDKNGNPYSKLVVEDVDDVLNIQFHIYLANEQLTGYLPVFEKENHSLIFWRNVNHVGKNNTCEDGCAVPNDPKHYIYTTKEYDVEVHEDEIKYNGSWKYLCHTNGTKFDYIWNLSDGYNQNGTNYEVILDAYYFRKYFDLTVETYFEEEIDRRGYVIIDIYDPLIVDQTYEDTGGRYLIICENGEMVVYKVLFNSTLQITTSLDETRLSKVIDAEGTITARKVSWPIKLYAGCDITMKVYDQSQDANAMATGFFDEMIGYKFKKQISGEVVEKGEVVNKPNLFGNADAGNAFVYTVKADEIDNEDKNKGKGYITGAQIKVGVHFEKIIYNLNFEIDSVYAGDFNVQANSAFSGAKTSYKQENMSVENFYEVEYCALAGFKLQQNAFVLDNGIAIKLLKSYNDDAPEENAQVYRLTTPNVARNLYGTWLRLYYYCSHLNYGYNDSGSTSLGTLIIQTEAIMFTYGVKVYDETDDSKINENYIIETPEKFSTTLALSKVTGSVLTPKVSTYLTDVDYGFWYYVYEDGSVDYALLSTRMYVPRNYLTQKNNHWTTYNFLLTNEPTNMFVLTSAELIHMVENFESGKIITKDNRNIFIMLEVRKLLEVKMSVEKLDKDTNSTTRTTVLSNTKNNSKSIVVNSGAGSKFDASLSMNPQSKGFYIIEETEISVVAYTYVGLENKLSSTYDRVRYDGVEYYLNGSTDRLAGNAFKFSEDGSLVIRYIPKALNVEISYILDGNQIADDDVSTYLNDNNIYKPNDYSVYYMGDKVTYMVECLNQDYHLKVSINGLDKGTTTNTNRKVYVAQYETINNGQPVTIDNRYVVSDVDYEFEKIKIEVQVFLKNNSKITIQYQLIDPTKKLIDDDYGTFDVFIFNSIQKENVSSTDLIVVEGRDIYVELDLNLGYSYTGKIKHLTDNTQTISVVDGKIKLISNFDPDVHYGDYYILIDKRTVSAVLNTTGLKAHYAINGKTNLAGLYVGQTIELTNIDVNEERLGCFYYLDKSGNKVNLTKDGTPLTSLKITSEFLNEIGNFMINFGVVAIKRYKLDLRVVGQEFLIKDSFKVSYVSDSMPYEIGKYVDEGTQLTLIVKSLITGKYDIKLEGGEFKFNDVVETEILVDEILVDELVVDMNKNCSLTLTVSPKLYEVNVSENVYTTLTAVFNNAPDTSVAVGDQVNNLSANGQNFNNSAVIEFVRKTSDRQLSAIFITGNDSDDEIVIEFNGDRFVTYKLIHEEDGSITKTVVELSGYGFKLDIVSETSGKLTYITQNDINIRFDYKMFKVIRT